MKAIPKTTAATLLTAQCCLLRHAHELLASRVKISPGGGKRHSKQKLDRNAKTLAYYAVQTSSRSRHSLEYKARPAVSSVARGEGP